MGLIINDKNSKNLQAYNIYIKKNDQILVEETLKASQFARIWIQIYLLPRITSLEASIVKIKISGWAILRISR